MKNTLLILFSTALLFGCASKEEKPFYTETVDVGNCTLPGTTTFNPENLTYTLTGSGLNMWGNEDAFQIAATQIEGDFTLTATISFEGEGVNAHRKMGLIIRETLDAGSPYADIAVHGDGLTSLQYREIQGDITKEVVSENKAPRRIKLERKGNRIIMSTGIFDLPENPDGEVELNLPSKCYVGLFICSHDDNVVEKGYFADVLLEK